MGTGALGNLKAPDLGSGNANVYLDLQDGFDNGSRRVLGGTSGAPTNVEDGFTALDNITGQMRFRMIYDAVAETVDYAIDYTPSAVFTAEQSFATVDVASISPEWAAGEDSSIYFGGQGGLYFTDFQVDVIPEPSVSLLGLLAVGCSLIRRRR